MHSIRFFGRGFRFSATAIALTTLAACGGNSPAGPGVSAYQGGVYALAGTSPSVMYALNKIIDGTNKVSVTNYTYDTTKKAWTEVQPATLYKYWALVDGKWKNFDDFQGEVISDGGTGVVVYTAPNGDTSIRRERTLDGTAIDVSGKAVKDVTPLSTSTATLPANSKAYKFGEKVNKLERMSATDDDYNGTGRNIINGNSGRATTFNDVLTRYASTGTRGLGYGTGTLCLYFGAGTTDGKLSVRGRDVNGSCTGIANTAASTTVTPYEGTWSIGSKMGQAFMTLNYSAATANPSATSSVAGLVIADGLVRYSTYQPAGMVNQAAYTGYNKTAFDFLLTEAAKLPATVE